MAGISRESIRIKLGKGLSSLLLVLLVAAPTATWAASLSGRASTQLMAYSDAFGQDHVLAQQYLRAHARGFDNAGTLTLSGYGRVSGDIQHGDEFEGRLYYLYLDKQELLPKTDLRIGRQFVYVGAGSAIIDGGRLDIHPFDRITLTGAGGRHVVFDLNGEATGQGDYATAFQLSFDATPDGSASVSWFRSHDESDLARDTLGFEGNKRFGKYTEAYSQLRANLVTDVLSEIDAGVRTTLGTNLTLGAEYLRTIPEFDATSIYSSFAVESFEYGALRAQYDSSSNLSFTGEYRHERYGDGGKGNGAEAGVRYKPWDGSLGSLYGGAIWRTGAGGNILGFELSGDYTCSVGTLLVGGIQRDAFQTDMMTDARHATKFWGGIEKKLAKNLALSGRVEDTITTSTDKDVRARLTLNVNF